ncbi:hypothetical protein MLD38_023061 [Melastoma candidum]|uniref:Uncharacterized protein n=1 Tax=Melastoma candidum TaxID=119954 RepID=A0ACB9QPS4_9MYRT|nr:hypothetical protein MLD38_023061 [Melastoma candidum]
MPVPSSKSSSSSSSSRRRLTGLEPLDTSSVPIPDHFRCPISLELMLDPVTISTGHTYDRSSIESWVATGNTTCPVTRSPLADFSLIPNHTLRRLIQDWCVSHPSLGVPRIPTPKQPADPSLLRSLLSRCSPSPSPSPPPSLLRRLLSLSLDSDANRSLLCSLGAPRVFLALLFPGSPSSGGSPPLLPQPDLVPLLLALLALFPIDEPDCVAIATEPYKVGFLVRLLFDDSAEVRIDSAEVIEAVVAGLRSPELRAAVACAEGALEGVVNLLRWDGAADPRAAKVGIKALFALCLAKQARQRAVAAGAAEAVIDRMAAWEGAAVDKCDIERAVATTELLCRVPQGRAAVARHRRGVGALVGGMTRVSERVTEYAAGALLSLCSGEEACRREAVRAGVLPQLLVLVQSDCTERAKRKAQMLLKLLRDAWPSADSVGNSDDLGCSEIGLQF